MAWKEFKNGKTKKSDVRQFEDHLEDNIVKLNFELKTKTYKHSRYYSFYIQDPKLRHIHKACVRDRVLHHAVFRILYPIFDKSFIFDSYSCRNNKGTHRAVNRLHTFFKKVSKNNARTCWVLKCDVKKFFDSVNQDILMKLIKSKITGNDTMWLINNIIKSFNRGIPLGNITSQLFANIYLNQLDQFIKHRLKVKYYIRYCDDFVILSHDTLFLERLIFSINNFLKNELKLSLHPNKIILKKYYQGIDFLGYVSFPDHRVLRIKTKKRIFKKINFKMVRLKQDPIFQESFYQTLQSYFGVLKHCNGYKIRNKIITLIHRYQNFL